jgi:outer membrane protein assembly factor BamA
MESPFLSIVPGVGMSGLLDSRGNDSIVDVTFTGFRETRRGNMSLEMAAAAGYKEKTVGFRLEKDNIFWGCGESLSFHVGAGRTAMENRVELMQPYAWGRGSAVATIFSRRDTYDLRHYAEHQQGFLFSAKNADEPGVFQEILGGVSARSFKAGNIAPPHMLSQDGVTAKVFAAHTIRLNKSTSLETSPGFLSAGNEVEFANEVAYVAGVTPFLKAEAKGRYFHGLVEDLIAFSAGFTAGAILSPPGCSVRANDRFYPQTIGFSNHVATPSQALNPNVPSPDASEPNPEPGQGAGAPRGQADWPPRAVNPDGTPNEVLTPLGNRVGTLGAGLYGQGDVRIKANIPNSYGIPVHAQAFVNAAVGYKDIKDYLTARRSIFADTKDHIRVNAGLGIVVSLMGSSFQFNLNFPLVYKSSDSLARFSMNAFPGESL